MTQETRTTNDRKEDEVRLGNVDESQQDKPKQDVHTTASHLNFDTPALFLTTRAGNLSCCAI
jgi:hypothetical protein